MAESEANIQRRIQLALSEAGCLVWRNETAGVWLGKPVHREGDTVTLANARHMTAGLCVGSSDLVGCCPRGRLLCVEVKTPRGRVSAEQRTFIEAVNTAGGIAGVCRSVDEALALIQTSG